jgi:hypothetical protein
MSRMTEDKRLLTALITKLTDECLVTSVALLLAGFQRGRVSSSRPLSKTASRRRSDVARY